MIDLYEYFTSHEYLPKRLHEALQNFSNEYEYLVLEDEEVLCDKQEDIRCLNELLPQNTLFYKYFLYALLDENHLKRKPKNVLFCFRECLYTAPKLRAAIKLK